MEKNLNRSNKLYLINYNKYQLKQANNQNNNQNTNNSNNSNSNNNNSSNSNKSNSNGAVLAVDKMNHSGILIIKIAQIIENVYNYRNSALVSIVEV